MLQWIRNQSKQLAGFSLAVFMLSMVSIFCQNCFSGASNHSQASTLSSASEAKISEAKICHDSNSLIAVKNNSQFKDCCAADSANDNASLIPAMIADIEVEKTFLSNSLFTLKIYSVTKSLTSGYTPHFMAHADFSFRNPVLLS